MDTFKNDAYKRLTEKILDEPEIANESWRAQSPGPCRKGNTYPSDIPLALRPLDLFIEEM